MDDEPDQQPFDYLAPEVVEARDAVARAVQAYVDRIHPGESPYVVAWAVGVEWTNADLEQRGRAGRDVISPSEQPVMASAGVGLYLANRFGSA